MYASITYFCIRMFHEKEMMHSIERDSRLKCVQTSLFSIALIMCLIKIHKQTKIDLVFFLYSLNIQIMSI